MNENITFSQTSNYNKRQYTKVIDTSFTQLGVQTIQEQITQQPTVSDFFNMYN